MREEVHKLALKRVVFVLLIIVNAQPTLSTLLRIRFSSFCPGVANNAAR
jgi:hypothetical protein